MIELKCKNKFQRRKDSRAERHENGKYKINEYSPWNECASHQTKKKIINRAGN